MHGMHTHIQTQTHTHAHIQELQQRDAELVEAGAQTEHIHDTMLRLRAIAEVCFDGCIADKDVVTRTHSLALENSQRREELQVLNSTRQIHTYTHTNIHTNTDR